MRSRREPWTIALVVCAASLMFGCGGGGGGGSGTSAESAVPLTVPKATCGANDNPESALQGQVTAAMRANGFKGFNCNLQLVGQYKGEGGDWSSATFKDKAGR